RIYVTGFSNGASMTYRVGAELSDQVAAIAPVSGHFWLRDDPSIQLKRPVPLLFIYGTLDPLNPPQGGPARNPWGGGLDMKPPIFESPAAWLKLDHCSAGAIVIYNQNGVTGRAYRGCDQGSEVVVYMVEGMGHVWPGGLNLLPQLIVGPDSDQIN